MLAEYVYLGDQLLAMIRPGESVYYFHNDHLGTPQVLTDDSQAIAWKAVYTPFGDAVPSIQTVENPFRFPGQYYDPETGLHYNYFRYYNPQTGRYITPDPIGLEGGINLFVYTENNPAAFVDPLGLWHGYSGVKGLGLLFLEGLSGRQWALYQIYINRPYVEAAAIKYNLDPNLLRAIIYEEQSHLLPPIIEDLVGGSAIGLGQFTPQAWSSFGEGCLDNRNDPQKNIEAMAKYVDFLRSIYGNDMGKIGSGYNFYDPSRPTPQSSKDYGKRINLYYRFFSGK